MQINEQATPRPWEQFDTTLCAAIGAVEKGHKRIAECKYNTLKKVRGGFEWTGDQDAGTAFANARFIVKSVNCYDELVEALKDVTQRYERLEMLYAEVIKSNYDCENGSIKRAKQALSKAESNS